MRLPKDTFAWPRELPRQIQLPRQTIAANLEAAARRHPDLPAIHFLGRDIPYRQLLEEIETLAGWLATDARVRRGDRVILHLQNSPQWIVAYYAILRADAVVVPINPMTRESEIRHYLQDSGARVAITAGDIEPNLRAAAADGQLLDTVLVATYADALGDDADDGVPEWVFARIPPQPGNVPWAEALAARCAPAAASATADDLCGLSTPPARQACRRLACSRTGPSSTTSQGRLTGTGRRPACRCWRPRRCSMSPA